LIATPLGAERAPIYSRMIERLDVLTPARPLPTSDNVYITAPSVRGLVIHPALSALFPHLDVMPKPK